MTNFYQMLNDEILRITEIKSDEMFHQETNKLVDSENFQQYFDMNDSQIGSLKESALKNSIQNESRLEIQYNLEYIQENLEYDL